MANHVRPEARSFRAILAVTAAKIGAAPMIATTLATSVLVMAVTKAVVLTAPITPVRMRGFRYYPEARSEVPTQAPGGQGPHDRRRPEPAHEGDGRSVDLRKADEHCVSRHEEHPGCRQQQAQPSAGRGDERGDRDHRATLLPVARCG